jgi:hypothetical protein
MTIRRALLLGFGAIVLLWLLSAYVLVQRLHELELRSTAISARFDAGEDLLVGVRDQVVGGSVFIRDVALELDLDQARGRSVEVPA